ncbi:DUF4148 domain-containing protein [Paraburkholderia sp. MMS20-SJTR3]|uniref:DUF4148 domain-containing protein n=1 Tax=Paraburkholderia sejongensis TaxID=2886946 RepID=A0ABS8JZI3_9BURK|nr:DUF4148 domain-containing protein [Paraburkholderia sp. MMS20-SJTR3]MCC8395223.1 DUF4148 domain-containing protein [Paraburkholderia sp. MMS20-SJTR3]
MLTGLVVGALALGAYVTQSDGGWLSSDELRMLSGDSIRGTAASGRVLSLDDAAETTHVQRRSTLRNDVSAINPLEPVEPRVHAGPLQAPPETGLGQRSAGSLQAPAAKSAPSRDSRAALREQVKRASSFPKRPLRAAPPSGPVSGLSQAWLLNDRQRSHPAYANNRPKTRAEVVAELARARKDGSMPAFGNPNPGPGGMPGQSFYDHP